LAGQARKEVGRGGSLPIISREAILYEEWTLRERFNNRLKEEFGGINVSFRSLKKAELQLKVGGIALFIGLMMKLQG
jgi:hypothetical protein